MEPTMFSGPKYATRGVCVVLSPDVQLLLWTLIEGLARTKTLDYLQVFELSPLPVSNPIGNQRVIHSQEQPAHQAEFIAFVTSPVNAKVYVIDDGDYSTMLLAEEY